jgi:hypothetical protein
VTKLKQMIGRAGGVENWRESTPKGHNFGPVLTKPRTHAALVRVVASVVHYGPVIQIARGD